MGKKTLLSYPIFFLFCAAVACCITHAFCGGYSLRDTVQYSNDIYSGNYSRLFHDSVCIDSIETDFGLKPVGQDSVIYLRVEELDPVASGKTGFTELVLAGNGWKINIGDSLPMYNNHFSSPGTVDSCLYYWGLTMENVYAVKVDFKGFRTDSVKLDIGSGFITVSPDYFSRPAAQNGEILFAVKNGKRFIVSQNLQSVKILP
jgi:hypothetical protein